MLEFKILRGAHFNKDVPPFDDANTLERNPLRQGIGYPPSLTDVMDAKNFEEPIRAPEKLVAAVISREEK